MITIKLECGCGQRYAFDVEDDATSLLYPVACPVCGLDGTAAANAALAQSVPAEPAFAAAPAVAAPVAAASAVHLAQPAARIRTPDERSAPAKLMPGQVPREQAESEARAKIFWGDPPEEVTKFLMRQNVPRDEARELVRGYFDERAAALRSKGIGRIVSGVGMALVPVISWFTFEAIGVIPMKLFAVTVMIGLWGAWRVVRGLMMVLTPRSETGEVAD